MFILLFIVIGGVITGFGLLNLFSRRFYQRTSSRDSRSKYDINILSPRTRYLFSRYDAGAKFVLIGIVLIAVGFMFFFSQS